MKTRSNKNIPRTEKYQMGGSRNMRGYNYEDIGPQIVDADKQSGVITQFNAGGQFSVLSQFELEHPLIKEAGLKWVLFYDAGNVYQEAFEADKFV